MKNSSSITKAAAVAILATAALSQTSIYPNENKTNHDINYVQDSNNKNLSKEIVFKRLINKTNITAQVLSEAELIQPMAIG